MEMTTPVITNAGQDTAEEPTMQFVIEERFGSQPEQLPAPNNTRCCILPFASRPTTTSSRGFVSLLAGWYSN